MILKYKHAFVPNLLSIYEDTKCVIVDADFMTHESYASWYMEIWKGERRKHTCQGCKGNQEKSGSKKVGYSIR